MELSVHDEHAAVAVRSGSLLIAQAYRCSVVTDHWWLVLLNAEGDDALDAIQQVVDRLRARHALQVNVATNDVRPDLGRPFFTKAGFERCPSDLTDSSPLELSLSQ